MSIFQIIQQDIVYQIRKVSFGRIVNELWDQNILLTLFLNNLTE